MRSRHHFTTIDVHAEGEIGRVATAGIPAIPGRTMVEKMRHMNEAGAGLRRLLVSEPRASAQMSTNLLLPPTRPDADAAFLVLQIDRAHAMSGSNAICVTTALLESGAVPMVEPETVVRLDTPAGLVIARAACRDGRCERVTLDMPPCFALELDVVVETPGFGRVTGDVAYGGIFYLLVDVERIGLTIRPEHARGLVAAGIELLAEANRRLDVRHPDEPGIAGISYVMFRGWDETRSEMLNATVLWPGRIDRSPCGTGTSARLSVMVARGEAKAGDRLVARSIVGGRFDAEIARVEAHARAPVVHPRISGRGWVYGSGQLLLDPTDPFPEGHTLSDTWGPGLG